MIDKPKILCVGDSLSLPGHGNKYEDTWFCQIKNNFSNYEFISSFRRATTTTELVMQGGDGSDTQEIYNPDIIILQIGIVDCSPRLYRRSGFSAILLKILPKILASFYIIILKRVRGRKANNVWVNINQFKSNLNNYIERCKENNVRNLILIEICVPNGEFIRKSPRIIENVEKYNSVFHELAKKYKFIRTLSPLDSRNYSFNIFDDGYHPNPKGNFLVYKDLSHIIEEISIE